MARLKCEMSPANIFSTKTVSEGCSLLLSFICFMELSLTEEGDLTPSTSCKADSNDFFLRIYGRFNVVGKFKIFNRKK
jgi:hypothetical protein